MRIHVIFIFYFRDCFDIILYLTILFLRIVFKGSNDHPNMNKMSRILLQKSPQIPIDLQRCVRVLQMICSTLEFEVLPSRDIDDFRTLWIDRSNNCFQLSVGSERKPYDLYFYITYKTFIDFHIVHERSNNIIVLSFSAWEHFSGLPIENGIIHFIARSIAIRKIKAFRARG